MNRSTYSKAGLDAFCNKPVTNMAFALVRIQPNLAFVPPAALGNPLRCARQGLPASPEDPDVELYFHHNFLDVSRCGSGTSRPADFKSAASTGGPPALPGGLI